MNHIIKILSGILFPKETLCCICGRSSREAVCGYCIANLEFLEGRVCLKCGKGIDDEYSEAICPDCRSGDKHYDMAFSCFAYRDMGKQMIHKLKYEGQREMAHILAKLMYQKLKDESVEFDAVVPVPIHPNKEAARGFNQAKLIALEIAGLSDTPMLDCLIRTKETREQFKLDKIQRALNVHNAFCINILYNNVKPRRILLIDDIYTTGSTVGECSRILKQYGAQRVYVITAATGSNT